MNTTTTTTARGGYGFAIQLHSMQNTPAVFWLNSNSYVSDGSDTYSINGIGEIRWKVERWNPEYRETRAYFGLPCDPENPNDRESARRDRLPTFERRPVSPSLIMAGLKPRKRRPAQVANQPDPEPATFITVNGDRVYFTISEDGESLHLDESCSEQCEGCGVDIIESGRVPRAPKDEVRCACGSVYIIHTDAARARWDADTRYTR